MRDFGEFVHSPYFNKNQGAVKLFDHIKKFYPEFDSGKLEKEKIYQDLFGKTEYNDGFVRTIMHILTDLIEEFLAIRNLNSKQYLKKLLITDELNQRKLEKLINKSFADSRIAIDKLKTSGDTEYYYYRYLYAAMLSGFKEWTRYKSKNLKDFDGLDLTYQVNSLASFFVDKTLIAYRTALSKKQNISIDFESGFIDSIIKYVLENENEIVSDPKIKMHLYETMLYRDKPDAFFFLLKDMLNNANSGLLHDDKYTLHNILQQYCVQKTISGETSFSKFPLELYKTALAGGFYKGQNNLCFDPVLFPNIVFAAIREKEFQWAENFIEEYSGELSEENREVVIAICKGKLCFEQGNFSQALTALTEAKSILHVPFKVSIRNLTLMIYFELAYFEQAEYLLASYRKFITVNRNLFAKDRYERQMSFMKLYSKLLRIKEKGLKEELPEIFDFMQKNRKIAEGKRLKEKASMI